MSTLDLIVVGGGLDALAAALRARSADADARILIVDRQPWLGHDVRSQRSNGFTCELGPIAFTDDELATHRSLLKRPPREIRSNQGAKTGWLFDGERLQGLTVQPEPISFATGCEDLIQAYRRELDGCARLGRAVTDLRQAPGDGFRVTLGGEVPTELETQQIILATSSIHAARILGSFDPELPAIAEQETRTDRAYVWLGGLEKDVRDLQGYGVLPHPQLETQMAELIYCSNVFPNRTMPGRFLLRSEITLEDPNRDDQQLRQEVETEVRRWTKTEASFGFYKVHRFSTPTPDGIRTECRIRVQEITSEIPGLTLL